jgi:hypothetical protein
MGIEDDPGPAIGTTGARFGGAARRRRTARRKGPDADIPPEPAPEPDTVALPVTHPGPVPRGGARWHGAPVVTPVVTPSQPAVPAGPAAAAEVPEVGLTGARFGGVRKQRKARSASEPVEPEVAAPAPSVREVPPPPDEDEPVVGGSASVRPYVFTRGRTRAAFELSLETLVSAVPQSGPPGLTGVHQAVLGLCREPRSVAELAARVGVPLGVARVLVGDLAATGAVAVHRVAGADGPDLALMQRVLSGLRRL